MTSLNQACRTKSKVTYRELKSQVIRLASATIHQQLFEVLVPGIWWNCTTCWRISGRATLTRMGRPSILQPKYTTQCSSLLSGHSMTLRNILLMLRASSWIISTPLTSRDSARTTPIMAGLAPTMHSPSITSSRTCWGHSSKPRMMSAVLEIVSGTRGSEQLLASPGKVVPSFPSVARKTLQWYLGGDEATRTSKMIASTYIQPSCFGYGDSHPWSKKVKGV